jgi:5-formyltetrahydrofolate cyclo-ligase
MRRVLELPETRAARLVALYASIGAELDTRALIAELIRLKGAVALPRARRDPWRLDFHRVTEFPTGFLRGVQGIHEPDPAHCGQRLATAELDLILVPGLLFDRQGYRIGYGGGYYDWLLAEPGRPRGIGLAFSAQLVPPDQPLPLDPWDRPVDALATERELIVVDRDALAPSLPPCGTPLDPSRSRKGSGG